MLSVSERNTAALRRTFGPPSFQERGEFAQAFGGLTIAVTEAIQHQRGDSTRFTTHWLAVNRDSDTKFLALSTAQAETYIQLARTTDTLSIRATGITICENRYGQTGCRNYTTIQPGQRLSFILVAGPRSGLADANTIGIRARFTINEQRSRSNPSAQPANIDVEFQNIDLSNAPWEDN